MRKFILAIVLFATPASAVEVVINGPDFPTLVGLAVQMGYATVVNGQPQITQTGMIATGGSYFVNKVGRFVITPAVYDNAFPPNLVTPSIYAPGVWLRIRHNGDPAQLPAVPANAAAVGVTVYRQLPLGPAGAICWSSDYATCSPLTYLDRVGPIM